LLDFFEFIRLDEMYKLNLPERLFVIQRLADHVEQVEGHCAIFTPIKAEGDFRPETKGVKQGK
jgi:hypothetical protein